MGDRSATRDSGVRVAAVLASTIDGRLAHPEIAVLGSDHDRRRLENLRAQADVLLYGAGTARADNRRRIEFRYPEIARPVQHRIGLPVPPIAVLCRRPTFDFNGPFWKTPTPKLLLHAQRGLPDGHDEASGGSSRSLASPVHLPDDVSYLAVPTVVDARQPDEQEHASMAGVLTRLSQWLAEVAPAPDGLLSGPGTDRPIRVLCEGGGSIVAALMRGGLLDELFLTLTGWVAGDDKDTPFSVGGHTGPQHLTLQSADVSTSTSEIFLRYRREGREPWPVTEQR
jgi:riboflavin biosynthesis pyrimidine reductase